MENGINRYWALWWGVLFVLVVVTELLAIARKDPGDTLSEMVWKIYRVPGWGPFLLWMFTSFQLWAIVHFCTRGKV